MPVRSPYILYGRQETRQHARNKNQRVQDERRPNPLVPHSISPGRRLPLIASRPILHSSARKGPFCVKLLNNYRRPRCNRSNRTHAGVFGGRQMSRLIVRFSIRRFFIRHCFRRQSRKVSIKARETGHFRLICTDHAIGGTIKMRGDSVIGAKTKRSLSARRDRTPRWRTTYWPRRSASGKQAPPPSSVRMGPIKTPGRAPVSGSPSTSRPDAPV